MAMKFRILFTVLIFQILCFSLVRAQGYVDILPDEVKNPFQKKFNQLETDADKSVLNEWAGRYTRNIGETWSEIFIWTPEGGFAAFRDTCSNGPRAWVNYGSATFINGLLAISPERQGQNDYTLKVETQYTPVKWGQQHWLIPTHRLGLFAYAINSRSWEDFESFYLKAEDTEKKRTGQPNLPLEYKRLLARRPVKAKLLEVGKQPEKWYGNVTIGAGENKGIIVGMSFWLVGIKNTNVKISVVEVKEKTAIAEIVSVGYSYDNGDTTSVNEFVPRAGLLFTSRYQ
jgi:hypothetical protein